MYQLQLLKARALRIGIAAMNVDAGREVWQAARANISQRLDSRLKHLLRCLASLALVRRTSMMRLALHLFLAFAMMFGSVVVPAAAHSGPLASEAVALEAIDHQEAGCPDESRSSPDKADHIGHHHHCSAGIEVFAPELLIRLAHIAITDHPLKVSALRSRAILPLTEPPAA